MEHLGWNIFEPRTYRPSQLQVLSVSSLIILGFSVDEVLCSLGRFCSMLKPSSMATLAARSVASAGYFIHFNHKLLFKQFPRRSAVPISSIGSIHSTHQNLKSSGETPVPSRRNIVEILKERSLLESVTSEELKSACVSSNLKVYCGFDPTAESLHLGNLLGIIVLSWFQRCGHTPVALIGGATARIGDPSGKSLERPELDVETLERNTVGIRETIGRVLGNSNGEEGGLVVLNNYDWWKDMRLLDFLKRVGRYARVGTMMAKESVKKRLESEQGMSYTEFTYQLLQGYDFVYLFENEDVNVQIGGSDQWGNITAGTDLIRRISQAEGAYGLTFPLLLKSDGTKFGKSEDGAIWLSPSMLSPYKFYQYFFSVPDADVVRFLKILTFLDLEVVEEIAREMRSPGYVPNSAQRRLAEEVTRFVHGQEGLDEAIKATEALRPGAETALDWRAIDAIAQDVPSCSFAYNEVLNSSLVDLSVSSGLFETKSAARRLLKQGGVYLNNSRVDSDGRKIEAQDIIDGKVLLLSAGKKNKISQAAIGSTSLAISSLLPEASV
uniref:Tyrosine--tRNA ligase n=1 Tax=Kalanchoe fedtschenkoi TaxID=63787 RepID=A0A7N0ZYX1_KALFE